MGGSPERALVRQGWLQTAVVIVSFITAIIVAFNNLSNTANAASKKADDAAKTAADVADEARRTKDEFLKTVAGLASDVRNVKTILDERLPHATQPVSGNPPGR